MRTMKTNSENMRSQKEAGWEGGRERGVESEKKRTKARERERERGGGGRETVV